MAEEGEDFSKLPLTERWTHKVWKVRKEAYEQAAREFKQAQETDAIVRDFVSDSGLWRGAVADSNVAAQQEGLAALCAFLEIAGPPGCKRTRTDTITPIVEKGLTGRPAAKASATEALLLYIELDKSDPVIDELIPLLSHKQPKVIAATLSALSGIIHAYGCKTVEPKPIIKQLPKVYGHADKNVRAEAQNLTVELYRWLKDAMKPLFWGDLKPVQQTDLEKLFEKTKDEPPPKQERLLRSQQAIEETRPAAVGGNDAEFGGEGAEEPEIDLEPEYMTVNVFAKIPADFQDRTSSTKWKDRKEALDDLFAAVNVPAIEEGPFDDILRTCAKCMKDANIQVVQVAASSVECIAKGLRKKFAKYRSIILSPMLERFKEKKQSVTDALAGACDAVFAATGISDILEETLEFLKHKNPQVKLESTKFLTRSLKTAREAPQLPEVKLIADAAKALLSDPQEPTRNASAECLGVLWKIMGDRNTLAHIEGIEEIKKTKIKEFCDAAEVKAKWKPKAAPPPSKPAAGPAAGRKAPTAGGRRPGGPPAARRPVAAAARTASPPLMEDAPLAPRPTARPGAKPGGAPRGLAAPAAGGLKKPGLTRPGAVGSPSRPRTGGAEETAAPRGLPTPARSLASRPLSKAVTSPPASPSSTTHNHHHHPAPAPSLSATDRSELLDLRSETELLRQQNADLRADKVRLQSQVHELQNQNAQLIEDHTRDMLSVKAKETQLVRARGDVDEAEERVHLLTREVERLRRQLSVSPALSPTLGDGGGGMGMAAVMNGTSSSHGGGGGGEGKETTTSSLPRELVLPQRLKGLNGGGSVASAAAAAGEARVKSPPPPALPRAGGGGGGGGEEAAGEGRRSPAGFVRPVARPLSGFARQQGGAGGYAAQQQQQQQQGQGHQAGTAEQGQESWRRAAEVTQNLKARIEMMKAKQARGAGH